MLLHHVSLNRSRVELLLANVALRELPVVAHLVALELEVEQLLVAYITLSLVLFSVLLVDVLAQRALQI